MYKDLIGKKSSKVKNTVERGWVRKFAEAIGDSSLIYTDEEAAKGTKHQRNIAPVTFPITFNYGEIPGLKLPKKGLIHGEQSFHYKRPLFVGETVYCYTEIKDYYEKKGNFGNMGFLVTAGCAEDEKGELLYETIKVVIISEAVRKEMQG